MTIKRSTLHDLASHLAFEDSDGKAEAAYIIILDSILQKLFKLNFDHKYEFEDKVQGLLAELRTIVVTELPASMVLGIYKRLHLDEKES